MPLLLLLSFDLFGALTLSFLLLITKYKATRPDQTTRRTSRSFQFTTKKNYFTNLSSNEVHFLNNVPAFISLGALPSPNGIAGPLSATQPSTATLFQFSGIRPQLPVILKPHIRSVVVVYSGPANSAEE